MLDAVGGVLGFSFGGDVAQHASQASVRVDGMVGVPAGAHGITRGTGQGRT